MVDLSCVDQLQMKDLCCVVISYRNYTLAPDLAVFTVPHAVWQVKSQEDKDAAFGEYSLAEMNSDGNVEQRCADCASEAEHCQKAG